MSTELEQLRAYVNKIKDKQKQYYSKHRDGFLKNQKTYYEKNKDKILQKKKDYYKSKKAKVEDIDQTKIIKNAVNKVKRGKTTKILSV